MTPLDAAKILDLPSDASPEQIEARYLELRAKLEDKIAKAPTPGLKAKYRESLEEITTAFETLTLAADSSALPVIQKQGAGSKEQGAVTASTDSSLRSQVSGLPAGKRKSGSREFALVAVIALAVLAAGGWFVMKTRAENAEQARVAAEAKAEAETRKKSEEEERQRSATALKAEQERQEKLLVQLRAQLAELRTNWETFDRAERDAERALADARTELRSLRDATPGRQAEFTATVQSREDYYRWLSDFLLRHPARTQRARAEEMISARAPDDAAPLVAELRTVVPQLDTEIRHEREIRLAVTTSLELASDPAGVAWSFEDAFGRKRSGVTPARIPDVALGRIQVTFRRPGWADRVRPIELARTGPAVHAERYADHNRTTEWLFKAPVEEVEAAALDGWAEARLEMGDRHMIGVSGTIDNAAAFKWYEAARGNGHPGVGARLYLLGSRSAFGTHTREQEREWLWAGVKADDALSLVLWITGQQSFFPAHEIIPPARLAAAEQELTRQAAAGHQLSSLNVAANYFRNRDTDDREKAMQLGRAAIAAGNRRALRFVGLLLNSGPEAGRDPKASLDLLRQGAAANDTAAMCDLARAYWAGNGVEKNDAEALRWCRQAAQAGSAEALGLISWAHTNGRGVPKDEAEAFAWMRRSAEARNLGAMVDLGWAYQQGKGTAVNHAEALNWLRKAAVDSAIACYHLGNAYSNGWGVTRSDDEALAWWRKAGTVELPAALDNIGWAYVHGRGVPLSESEAISYWRRAAKGGSDYAQTELKKRNLTW
ncbi:MAG: hypothetical protein Q8J74_13530 [Candidatus Didemnitutus sp.]|nr:hypothetical protein [Candidatus Didemnitutus sp.]